ncbi:2365_t:CDS:2, partial [Acaulospora morrowiae]
CKELQEYCLESICDDPEPFFASKDFLSLDKEVLLMLITRDDLGVEEVDIWEHLIKWGCYQISGIRQTNHLNAKNFSENNFQDLKKTLDPFIPHVRFHNISLNDFFSKVHPYKKLLPNSLVDNMMSFLIAGTKLKQKNLPVRVSSSIVDSKIITRRHAAILSNWIRRKDAKAKGNQHQFSLLYRGTRDGFDANSFHNKVNGQGQAIVIIKVKDSGEIIGGFNASGWCNKKIRKFGRRTYISEYYDRGWIKNSDHFIFSFGSRDDYKTMKIGRLIDKRYGVYDYGGSMIEFGGSDLLLDGTIGTCNKNHYDQCILDTDTFIAEELEKKRMASINSKGTSN